MCCCIIDNLQFKKGDFYFLLSTEGYRRENRKHWFTALAKACLWICLMAPRRTVSTQHYCDPGWEIVGKCTVKTGPVYSSQEELLRNPSGKETMTFSLPYAEDIFSAYIPLCRDKLANVQCFRKGWARETKNTLWICCWTCYDDVRWSLQGRI